MNLIPDILVKLMKIMMDKNCWHWREGIEDDQENLEKVICTSCS